jgi:hypothetical protein
VNDITYSMHNTSTVLRPCHGHGLLVVDVATTDGVAMNCDYCPGKPADPDAWNFEYPANFTEQVCRFIDLCTYHIGTLTHRTYFGVTVILCGSMCVDRHATLWIGCCSQ